MGGSPADDTKCLTQYKPEWQCWEPGVDWVRQPPDYAITDVSYFDFYQPGMTFEHFVSGFSEWFSCRRPAAMLIGIRSDESFNRFLAVAVSGFTPALR